VDALLPLKKVFFLGLVVICRPVHKLISHAVLEEMEHLAAQVLVLARASGEDKRNALVVFLLQRCRLLLLK